MSAYLLERIGVIEVYYAPFDHLNKNAKVAIYGITPGKQQARNALEKTRELLLRGHALGAVGRGAKRAASFSGPMRKNLVAILDHVGLDSFLGIDTCADLFDERAELAHYTSVLRYPVFRAGRNYNGSPDMLKHPVLKRYIDEVLTDEVGSLPRGCVHIPLGRKPAAALRYVESRLAFPLRILSGIPHPSGANNERIAYFLGNKPRHQLSFTTNAAAIDKARRGIVEAIRSWGN
jgi:hypothetical protein